MCSSCIKLIHKKITKTILIYVHKIQLNKGLQTKQLFNVPIYTFYIICRYLYIQECNENTLVPILLKGLTLCGLHLQN